MGRFGLLLAGLGLLSGCGGAKQPEKPRVVVQDIPVQILVLDDPPLADSIRQTWAERGEGKIEVLDRSSQAVIDSPRRVLDADVVVYPAPLLGTLVERKLIVPLDPHYRRDKNLAVQDLFPAVRLRVAVWDRELMGSSLGNPNFLLLYRPDVFAQFGLEAPQTWDQYAAVAEKLADRNALGDLAPSTEDEWLGACEPGGLWSAELLLARAACYTQKNNDVSIWWEYRTMEPRLGREPFVRALREMASDKVNRSLSSPAECYAALLTGRCAMAIAWPNGWGVKDLTLPDPKWPVRLAALPGAGEVFGDEGWAPIGEPQRVPLIGCEGRLMSVTREAQRRDMAAQRVVWLSGKEWGERVGLNSQATMPARVSSRLLSRWTGETLGEDGLRDLSDILSAEMDPQDNLVTIRIPGRQRYLGALRQALESLTGKDGAPSDEAIRAAVMEATRQWESITDEIGRAAQRSALGKSQAL
ncbi:MAG: extracellular solute-binding protein [Planctomycetales bacterium]|nr:extracellular solute-binding protein [Planctomycetales bacterium]